MPQKPSVAIWSSVRYSSLRDSRVLRRAFVGGLMGIDIASPNALTYRETGEQVVRVN